jgi:radical SAM protein (TIGR04043 family)
MASLPTGIKYATAKTDELLYTCTKQKNPYLAEIRRENMDLTELARVKAELLCFGVQFDEGGKEDGVYRNSYLFDGAFVHAAHFLINGIVINTCVSEKFCKDSPYVIVWEDEKHILKKNGIHICPIDVLQLPEWSKKIIDGYRIGDYIRPHSPNCISGCPKLRCGYYHDKNQCKFCSLATYAENNNLIDVLPERLIVEMIKEALDFNPNYEIALSGGTCSTEDKSARYFANICRELTSNREKSFDISIELAPPDKDSYIEELYNAGATALIMNIEIANEDFRKKICPGKSGISLDRYFSAFKKGVALFGRGKISSVLIAGIQPVKNIIDICKRIIPMGVVPTIIPFKPLDNSLMNDEPTTNPEEVLDIAWQVNELLKNEGLFVQNQGGCTKCGGCSLESVFQLK